MLEIDLQEREVKKVNQQLENTLAQVKELTGLLPICAQCKKIRDDQGYWNNVEKYLTEHSKATFTHGICPDCAQKLYPHLSLSALTSGSSS